MRFLKPALVAASVFLAVRPSTPQIFGREEIPTNMVQFNLAAVDAKGQSVGDLTADDLQITDNGKPQKIVLFRHSETRLQQSTPLRTGELTNRVSSNVPRATLILFDLLNENFSSRGTAVNGLAHGLQALESADYVYVYLLTQDGRLYPVHPLPGAGGEAANGDAALWTKNSRPLLDQAINKVYRLRPVELDIDTRVHMTYRALDSVANMLAGIPGRKNVVWITHGVPISLSPQMTFDNSGVDYTPLLRQMSLRFDRANVAIYPVQQSPPGMSMQNAANGDATNLSSGLGSEDTLQQFADLTGGPSHSTGDIGQIVRQAMADARSSYLVGYYPPGSNWDGKFHKLKIACRIKGVRIVAKTGYFAVIDQNSEEQNALDIMSAASFDASEIEIRVKISASPAAPDTLHLNFRIDPAGIRFADENGKSVAHLSIQMAGYSSNGQMHRSQATPLDLSYTAAEKPKIAENWIEFQEDLKQSDVEKVRLMVYDKGSRAVGSLTMPAKP